ncbi:PAS domain S-box protein [Halosimplex aquaticum]
MGDRDREVYWPTAGRTAVPCFRERRQGLRDLHADPDGVVVSWNEGAQRIKGYSEEEIVGEHFSTFYTEEDREAGQPEYNLEAAREHDRVEDEGYRVRKDGSTFWGNVTITAIRDEQGDLQGFTKVTRDMTERHEYEERLRQEKERFETLIQEVRDYAIFMLDTDGFVQTWNDGARELKGYTEDEIVGEHFSTFYTEEDRKAGRPERNLRKAAENGRTEDERWRVRKDGEKFWANVIITALHDDDGELRGFAKVTRDMTERKEREQQLQRERDLIEQILETSPVGITVVNSDGSTNRANERMAELLGNQVADMSEYMVGQRDMYGADREVLPVEERPANRVFETSKPVYDREILFDPPDGQKRWLSINASPITDEQGEPEQAVITATNITELKEPATRRKRELEEREKDLAAVKLATNLLEPSEQPLEELLEGFVTSLSESFRYPDSTAVRVSVGDQEVATERYRPSDQSITAATRTTNGTPIEIDVVLVEAPESITEQFLPEEELLDTLVTLLRFHFERQEYIEQLQAETNRLEQFAYAASHDLQEPLRMISTYLQFLERDYASAFDEDGEDYLQFALDGAQRMREMIEGLLTYSRVETQGEPFEPVDLDAVRDDVLDDLQMRIAETNAEITAEPLPEVEGDAGQLRQVFQNLIDNAIEYSEDTPRVQITCKQRGSEWIISVQDEGIGIEPDMQEQIFDVFERLHSREEHDGTGIGLALCERIVERHGGEIWVESRPGEGSTFSFTLPAASSDDP